MKLKFLRSGTRRSPTKGDGNREPGRYDLGGGYQSED